MGDFGNFNGLLQKHVLEMFDGNTKLFVVSIDKDAIWNLYLDSFPEGVNLVYRKRREFDCSCCKSFIRTFGNVVAIKDSRVITIWDFDAQSEVFQPVVDALAAYVRNQPITDVFVTKQQVFGTAQSHEIMGGVVHTRNHFFTKIPLAYATNSANSEATIMGEYRDSKNVFQRSLEEISLDAIDTVIDLIAEKELYKGDEWQSVLTLFRGLYVTYHVLNNYEKSLYVWSRSSGAGGALSRIKNHSIGTLLVDLTSGTDVEVAVRKYEAMVAPQNYKRPKAIFTKKMVEDAQKTITELGLLDSLGRRHATLSDITINNILFANRNAVKRMGGGNVFDELRKEVVGKKPEGLPGVGIEEFIADILPNATGIEAWVEGVHEENMVSLIAPQVKNIKSLFKWDNRFSWAYNGNITDSMKQRVKASGGKVDGVLRFSIQWNTAGDNQNDYDAHCVEPDGNHIYFPNKGAHHQSTGMLDVDIVHPNRTEVAVENITWTDTKKMQEGVHTFYVHNYNHRGGRSGFSAEIEFDGKIFNFDYPHDLPPHAEIIVGKVKFTRKDGFELVESMEHSLSTKTVWGITTNQFYPVSVVMYSPNYWDGQLGIGHKHTFFMLQGCVNDTQPNGFFNEFLREEFMKHKRVFEALGGKMKVEQSSDQLSGLGFSSTKRNNLIVRVQHNNGTSKMYNLVF